MNDRERSLQRALHELLVKDSRDAAVLDTTLESRRWMTRVADVSTFEEAGV